MGRKKGQRQRTAYNNFVSEYMAKHKCSMPQAVHAYRQSPLYLNKVKVSPDLPKPPKPKETIPSMSLVPRHRMAPKDIPEVPTQTKLEIGQWYTMTFWFQTKETITVTARFDGLTEIGLTALAVLTFPYKGPGKQKPVFVTKSYNVANLISCTKSEPGIGVTNTFFANYRRGTVLASQDVQDIQIYQLG